MNLDLKLPRDTGADYERQAAEHFQKLFPEARLLERNFLCKVGEIDLIFEVAGEVGEVGVLQGRLELVFIEVRFRSASSWVGSLESIGFHKRRRLWSAIEVYFSRYRGRATRARVDLLCLDGDAEWKHCMNIDLLR